MAITDLEAAPPGPPADASVDNYLTYGRGLKSWLLTLDHKRIGILYLVSVLASFLLGGLYAEMIRTKLLLPGPSMVSANAYNQLFTIHGAVMIFMFIIPGIPAAIGNFVLPLMLGAKDVAFPRLNLLSYYCWVGGALFFVATLLLGGLDTGWTFYTPYSTTTGTRVSLALVGALILGFSSIFTGLNFVATIHTMRPAGMTWFRMPLMLWGSTPRPSSRSWPRPYWPSR